jgi:hypothetical protein
MGGKEDIEDLLGLAPEAENLVDAAPKKRGPRGPRLTVNRNNGPSKALLERSRSYPSRRAAPKKNSPERLKRLLDALAENGVENSACLRAGVSLSTVKWWLQKSSEGVPGDGFDVVFGKDDENESGDTVRFHDAWDIKMREGIDNLETVGMRRAMGYREVLTYQGRVIYQQDPDKLALGLTGIDAYLLDAFGAPVPETVERMDPDLLMYFLTHRKPEVYSKKSGIDINVGKGGVLVVGVRAATSEDLNEREERYRKEGRPAVTFDEGDDDDGVA